MLSEGLASEWDLRLPLLAGKRIVSVYFGGGTPTLFDLDKIAKVIQSISFAPNCELSIEANPKPLDLTLLKQLRQIGFNRLSLGVQSLDDSALETLERRHSANEAKAAIWNARAASFENISIDLMFDLPWQTEESWRKTLDQLPTLPITHLSLYNLTFEANTSFFKRRSLLQKAVPHPELSLQLLEMAVESCEQVGLMRYEISAFAKDGFQSRHNSGYWTGRPFLGFGPSAFSYWEGKRSKNWANIERYSRMLRERKIPLEFEEELSYPANWKERLAINLRLLGGVTIDDWPLPQETKSTLERLKNEGYLLYKENHLRLSAKGLLFYDSVAAELI
jgi:oxygen-independent coproporphyrinogen-3 oxidase